jgi:hypothetical protein
MTGASVVTSRLASLAAHSSFFRRQDLYVPHLLLVAEIQRVGSGRSVLRGNFAITSRFMFAQRSREPSVPTDCLFGAFYGTRSSIPTPGK